MHDQTTQPPPVITAEQLAGVSVGMDVAAPALNISRDTAYRLASAGEFPCRVIRVGRTWTVPTGGPDGLRAVLGL